MPVDEPADAIADELGAPTPAEATVGVASQERHKVSPGGEQRGVDVAVARQLADPGRHEGDGRAQTPIEQVLVAVDRSVVGRRYARADHVEQLLTELAAPVAILHATHRAQHIERARGALGDR